MKVDSGRLDQNYFFICTESQYRRFIITLKKSSINRLSLEINFLWCVFLAIKLNWLPRTNFTIGLSEKGKRQGRNNMIWFKKLLFVSLEVFTLRMTSSLITLNFNLPRDLSQTSINCWFSDRMRLSWWFCLQD